MNPWEEISLSDYENHMKLDSVKQMQAMNDMMNTQFAAYPITTAIVLGIAGGNGLEYVNRNKYQKVYGIDIMGDLEQLPKAELVIANLFIEYVGYQAFKNAILKTGAKYVLCIIQINTDDNTWVSESPYLHAFDNLDSVHNQIDERELTFVMKEIGYIYISKKEYLLPNEKKLVMLDYKNNNIS